MISWDTDRGIINSLYGVKIKANKPDTPINIAKSFISNNKEIFGVSNLSQDLLVTKNEHSKNE